MSNTEMEPRPEGEGFADSADRRSGPPAQTPPAYRSRDHREDWWPFAWDRHGSLCPLPSVLVTRSPMSSPSQSPSTLRSWAPSRLAWPWRQG